MKRIITLIAITLSIVFFSKAQSEVKIDTNDLNTRITAALANLPTDLDNIDINLDAMSKDLADLDIKVDLNDLSELSSIPDLNNTMSYSYNTTETPQNSDVFNQLSNVKGVQVVYISKAMLGMMPNMDMPGADIGNIAGKLESLEIYTAENDATKRLKEVSEKLLQSGSYETLMLVKDTESNVAFYMKKGTSGKGSEMLMVTDEENEATIIRFLGNFTMEDIKKLTNQDKNSNTTNRLSEAELEVRMKEAEKRNKEAQKIAEDAQKRAIEAQKRADAAEKKAKEAEEKAKKAN